MKIIQWVILDTNVFISAIFWSGAPHQIFKAWLAQKIELIVSVEIFEEYCRVFEILSKKYPPVDASPFIELIMREAHFFQPIALPSQVSADPDDDKFIACGLAAGVDYIISGDKDLLEISGYNDLKIIKPRDFLNLISKQN